MTISPVAPAVTATASTPDSPVPSGWQGLFAGLLGGSATPQDGAAVEVPSEQDAGAPAAVDILSAAQVMAAAQVVPVTPVLAAAVSLSAAGTAVSVGSTSGALAAPAAPVLAGQPGAAVLPSVVPTATPSAGSVAVSAGDPAPPPVATSAVPLAAPATTEVQATPATTGPAGATAPATAAPAATAVSAGPATPQAPGAPGAPVPGSAAGASADPATDPATTAAPATGPAPAATTAETTTASADTASAPAPDSPATDSPAGIATPSTGQGSGQDVGQQGTGQQSGREQGQQALAAPQHAVHHRAAEPATEAAPAQPLTGTAGVSAPAQVTAPAERAPAVPHAHVTGQVFPEVARLVSRGDGTRRITLKLSPEALGDVRVTLTVRHGDVHVRMIGSEAAQQALRAGAGELQRLLEGTGASSGQIVVGDQAAADTGWQAGPGTGHHTGDDRPAGTRGGDTSARDGSTGGTQQRTSTDQRAAPGAITRTRPGVDVTM